MYQGETDSRSEKYANMYYNNYMTLHKHLTKSKETENELNLSFGALIHTVRYGNFAPDINKEIEKGAATGNTVKVYIKKVHDAKEQLVKNNSNIILGTDFTYRQYLKGNKTIFAPYPNNMHLHSAALSQVGREVARNIVNSKKLK